MAKKPRRRGWHDVDKADIQESELVQQFLMHQEDRNHSPKTVRWYSDMLSRFTASLPPEARLRDIDATAIRAYLYENRQNGASKFTLHAYARTLKTFLRWLRHRSMMSSSGMPQSRLDGGRYGERCNRGTRSLRPTSVSRLRNGVDCTTSTY